METMSYNFPIHIIGAGCICSNTAPYLVRMGFENLTIYDFDILENHNLKNQNYRLSDIGRLKVEALSDLIKDLTGVQIKSVNQKIEQYVFNSVVVCGVDSMAARRIIWEQSIKLQPQIDLYIEARVGGSALKVYALNPLDLEAIKLYEQNLHDDASALSAACAPGELPTLAATVAVIASLLKKYANGGGNLPTETIIETAEWQVLRQ